MDNQLTNFLSGSKVDLKQFRRISRDVTECDKGLAAVKRGGDSGALHP